MESNAIAESPVEFYLGRECDPATGEPNGRPIFYESRNLTTHGVVVGMTGSGKTGLCLTLMEEAAIDGIPAIMIDPKGDMSNLLLAFPSLRPEDFLPWIDPDDARRHGRTVEEHAGHVAASWKKGIADWRMTSDRIAVLKESAEFRVYTPGSEAGLPVSLIHNFDAPSKSLLAEDLRSKATATASALLGLAGIGGDAVRSKEHILVSNLLMHCWDRGENVPMEKLIKLIQQPPIRTLGVFDIDVFFPEAQRHQLAFSINNLLASPTFQSWMKGESLDFGQLLYGANGKPRHLVFSISHLGDDQRMFFVTLLLEQAIAWMRSQGGTSSLRALLYFDELFGFMPPHPANPPSKEPLLTLLKQARAYGLGIVLATQNPVDLDYKALSNAGTWFVGKLQTERDKQRLLDGLEGAFAAQGTLQDRATIDKTISALSNRKFLYHNVHESRPRVMQTRWALSYLRGPMSREQIAQLMAPLRNEAAPGPERAASSASGAASPESPGGLDDAFKRRLHVEAAKSTAPAADGRSTARPVLSRDVAQYFLPLRKSLAAALAELGMGNGRGTVVYGAGVAAHATVRFVDRKRSVDARQDYLLAAEAPTEAELIDWSQAERLGDTPWLAAPESSVGECQWLEIPTTINEARELRALQKDFERFLYDTAALPVYVNAKLGLSANVGEDRESFLRRCRDAAILKRDEEAAKQRPRLQRRLDQAEEKIRRGRQQLSEKEAELAARRRTETVSIFETMMGMFVGRRTIRGVSQASRKRGLSQRAELDVREAQDNLEAYHREMDALRAEWEDIAAELNDKWMQTAGEIDEFRVTPRKTDIAVPRFGIGWRPHWEIPLPAGGVALVAAY